MSSKNKRAIEDKNLACRIDEKVFFVIKYWIMSFFQGVAIIVVVFLLGAINALQLIILGIILFFISLVISRHFDKKITSIAKIIAKKLVNYPKIESLLLKSI